MVIKTDSEPASLRIDPERQVWLIFFVYLWVGLEETTGQNEGKEGLGIENLDLRQISRQTEDRWLSK